jgi:transcriptional regulator NrdR family protein
MKRLMGKTEVEDALERLDMLTKEENLMAVARTFEATHDINELTQHVDTKVTVIEEVVQKVDGNVRATQDNMVEIQELTHHVDDNVMEIQELAYVVHADVEVIKEGTRTIDDNVKVTKDGALIFQFLHTRTDYSLLYVKSNR